MYCAVCSLKRQSWKSCSCPRRNWTYIIRVKLLFCLTKLWHGIATVWLNHGKIMEECMYVRIQKVGCGLCDDMFVLIFALSVTSLTWENVPGPLPLNRPASDGKLGEGLESRLEDEYIHKGMVNSEDFVCTTLLPTVQSFNATTSRSVITGQRIHSPFGLYSRHHNYLRCFDAVGLTSGSPG